MNRRVELERKFGRPMAEWTQAQMLEALEELLPPRGKAGRPRKTDSDYLADENYAALAFAADELRASPEGVGMTNQAAMTRAMQLSISARNEERAERKREIDAAQAANDVTLLGLLEDRRSRYPPPSAVSERVLTPERVETAARGARAARRRIKANEGLNKKRI